MSYDEAQLPNPMELPAVEKDPSVPISAKIDQQGSERNPEFLPPVQLAQNNPAPDPTDHMATASSQSAPQAPPSTQPASLSNNAPLIADDVELIEKEWVEKAKEIVEKTRDNPYLQNKAISEIKADYIKKRYNKDIKSEE